MMRRFVVVAVLASAGCWAPGIDGPGSWDLSGTDFAMTDLRNVDQTAPDQAKPDLAMRDFATPDLIQLDLTRPPDLTTLDLVRPDLTTLDLTSFDLTKPPADMALPRDFTVPPDLTTPVDYSLPPDFTAPRDFTVPPDLTVLADMTIPPDLTAPPDLTTSPFDLVGLPSCLTKRTIQLSYTYRECYWSGSDKTNCWAGGCSETKRTGYCNIYLDPKKGWVADCLEVQRYDGTYPISYWGGKFEASGPSAACAPWNFNRGSLSLSVDCTTGAVTLSGSCLDGWPDPCGLSPNFQSSIKASCTLGVDC